MRSTIYAFATTSAVVWGCIHMVACITAPARYDIIAVKSRPQGGYDTLQRTYGCTATVMRNIPATRYFADGHQEEYTISGPIGYKDICK